MIKSNVQCDLGNSSECLVGVLMSVCCNHWGLSRSNGVISQVHGPKANLWSIPSIYADFGNTNATISSERISHIIYALSEFLHMANLSLIACWTICGNMGGFFLVFVLGHIISLGDTDRKISKELSNLREEDKANPEIQCRGTLCEGADTAWECFLVLGLEADWRNEARNRTLSPEGKPGRIPTSHPKSEKKDKMIEKSAVFQISVQKKENIFLILHC